MKFAVIDFETTGDQPGDEAIQVGLVVIEDGSITERYSSYIRPTIRIPEFITQLTGITDDDVKDAPQLEDVLIGMIPLLKDSVLVAHHAAFDLSFLQRSLAHCGYRPFDGRVLDTVEWLRMLFPTLPSLQLSMVSRSFDLPHDRPHQADSDAEATALIWIRCQQKMMNLPLLTLQRIAFIMETTAQGDDDSVWFAQQVLAERERTGGFDPDAHRYYRQFAIQAGDWTEEEEAERSAEELQELGTDFAEFAGRFKEALQEKLHTFEERPAQDQMMQDVYDSLASDRHLMVEAGTGTGKSLGYLIPALFYGIHSGKKVVVSTHTITLQEQLRERDIPLLMRLFPVPFRAAVMKGRHHYLCLRKFEHKINANDFSSSKEDRITAVQMIVWLGETKRGDDDELYFNGRGADFWGTVASDTDSCLNRACPWFKSCFYHRAKQEANIADVVITNHSLLFTDVKADNRLLPSYEHLILDEAHQLEEVASKHLGIDVHYFGMLQPMQRLLRDGRSGQLVNLVQRIAGSGHEQTEKWQETIEDTYPKLTEIKENWDKLCELLFSYASRGEADGGGEGLALVARIKADQPPRGWEELQLLEDNIFVDLSDVLRKLDKAVTELKESKDELELQGLVTDISGTLKDLGRARDSLRFFMKLSDPNYVYWLEANPTFKSKSIQLIAIPVDVSDLMREHFFSNKESVIMTSATLSVEQSFKYLSEALGLGAAEAEGRLKTVQLPSPFQYRQQALLVIPRDFPSVKGGAGDAEFIERLIGSLAASAQVTEGRMLVLFTSYKMLKQTYEPLKEALRPHGITVLGQGQESAGRGKLVRMFQQNPKSVLLGTSSFWEGVDIPGDALSCLAIVRLPFQPPNHPLVEARSEYLKKQNKNPFMHLSVPQAVIKFKQGFGRLIRTASDHGIVIVYDTRVLTTSYGKHFLYSLPGPKIEHMSADLMIPRIKEWLEDVKTRSEQKTQEEVSE